LRLGKGCCGRKEGKGKYRVLLPTIEEEDVEMDELEPVRTRG
jgi:hypothetical protein